MEESKANGVAGPAAMAEVLPPVPVSKTIGEMTKEEALTVENCSLRAEKVGLLKERLQQEALSIKDEEQKLQKDIIAIRDSIAARLGVPSEKIKLRRDGVVEEMP